MAYLKGLGTILKCEFTAPTFTTIAQRTSISGPSTSRETIDTTNLDSSAREFIASVLDNGEVSGQVFYDPDNSTHSNLDSLMASGLTKTWQIILTDDTPTTFEFDAVLTNWEYGGFEVDGVVTADYTLKVSGSITIS